MCSGGHHCGVGGQQHGHPHDHSHGEHHSHHDHGHEVNDPIQENVDESSNFTEKNRAHWNQFAAHYTAKPWQRDMINQITEFIINKVNWIGVQFLNSATAFEKSSNNPAQIRVLDYACGPGTVTNALDHRASEFVGIDLSENMVKAYNARFEPEQGSENIPAHAVVGDLLGEGDPPPSLSGQEFFNFDLAVVGLGFHHFENIQRATKSLVNRLKSGGVFLIIDFLPHGRDEHPAAHTVAHLGFDEELVKKTFGEAGLVDIDVVRMEGEVLMHGLSPRQPFMARGRKP